MANKKIETYRGVVIFGAPGTGKTTIAKALLPKIKNGFFVEASHAVIYPALELSEQLPATESKFISQISENYNKPTHTKVPREEARNFFAYLKKKYSPAVIAKSLIHIQKGKFKNKFLVLAGARGYENSIYFKEHGYLVVYLDAPEVSSAKRLARRIGSTKKSAMVDQKEEERIFSTNKISRVAHFVFNTVEQNKEQITDQIAAILMNRECSKCVNSNLNPSITIGKSGLCDICEKYKTNFDKKHLAEELAQFKAFKGSSKNKYDVMVGISGGKDSTATLYEVKRMGFTPLAFSLNTGYYPDHIFIRARAVAKEMGIDYVEIDVKKYIRAVDYRSFEKTADLYDKKESAELKGEFRKLYAEGRKHYSVKCNHALPFVRTCQLCRRVVVRAYYGEAVKRGIPTVVVGINEWAGLSQNTKSKKFVFSAIRTLKPFKNKPAVHVVHLPFLLQRTIADTNKILKKLGWKIPRGESLVESNSNSCLFAKAAENKARKMLGFHPDTTRLAREVTVGFITKEQAKKALSKIHTSHETVRSVLKKAGVI